LSVEGVTRAPSRVAACRWWFPNPGKKADEHGVVAIGADLRPSTLVHAYRHGIFPWPHDGIPLPWFSPDPRGVLPLDRLHVSKSLRQRIRRCGWEATVDADFEGVIASCAQRQNAESTWISPAMRAAYTELHRLGWAHSVEIWDGHQLIGGLYGMLVGGIFTGESMFHRATDASKVATVELVHRLMEAGGAFVDVQLVTDHLRSLGALSIPRYLFLELLEEIRDDDVRLRTDCRSVARLLNH